MAHIGSMQIMCGTIHIKDVHTKRPVDIFYERHCITVAFIFIAYYGCLILEGTADGCFRTAIFGTPHWMSSNDTVAVFMTAYNIDQALFCGTRIHHHLFVHQVKQAG